MRNVLAATLLTTGILLAACGGEGTGREPDPSANLLRNPGFEAGGDPWVSLDHPVFEVAAGTSKSGDASALLRMRSEPDHQGTKVHYLVQELTPETFPEVLSGYYRVDHWARGTRLQYLQVAVIVFEPENLPADYGNYQLRYVLAGVDREPLAISNARFVFLGSGEPRTRKWVRFEASVADDFERLWDVVPEGFSKLRVLFEVRYDEKAPGQSAEADVYYDDLYFGPGG